MFESDPHLHESESFTKATIETAEADCCHPECNQALVDEINRPGSEGWKCEDVCVIREREDDARTFAAEGRDLYHLIEGDRSGGR